MEIIQPKNAPQMPIRHWYGIKSVFALDVGFGCTDPLDPI